MSLSFNDMFDKTTVALSLVEVWVAFVSIGFYALLVYYIKYLSATAVSD